MPHENTYGIICMIWNNHTYDGIIPKVVFKEVVNILCIMEIITTTVIIFIWIKMSSSERFMNIMCQLENYKMLLSFSQLAKE